MIDLAKDLTDKTQKNIEHLSILCPIHNQIPILADLLQIHGSQGKTIVFT